MRGEKYLLADICLESNHFHVCLGDWRGSQKVKQQCGYLHGWKSDSQTENVKTITAEVSMQYEKLL